MSLEARVRLLEDKQEALDHAFRENNTILEATHGVVSLILNEQREMRKEQFETGRRLDHLKQDMNAHFNRVDARLNQIEAHFEQVDTRFDQLELLIRQHTTKN